MFGRGGYIFTVVSVCWWFVGLSPGLHKNYLTDFHETWKES